MTYAPKIVVSIKEIPEVDAEGNPLLDAEGNPITVSVAVEELVELTADEIAELEALKNAPQPLPDLTMRQFRLALISAGLDDDVEAALSALPGTEGKLARAEYEYASTVSRRHALIVSLSSSLMLTDEQVDALWKHALTL